MCRRDLRSGRGMAAYGPSLFLGSIIACSGDGGAPTPDAGRDAAVQDDCVDQDGDGRGLGARCAGDDCDDLDPWLTAQCGDEVVCAAGVHVTGCPCEATQPVPCFTGAPDSAPTGRCSTGLRACESGSFGPCEGQVLPVLETCNGQDDDCDGTTDDGVLTQCGDCNAACLSSGVGVGEDDEFDTSSSGARNVVRNADGSITLRGDAEVSNRVIWIANSSEGTISKVDTTTHEELGRYYTDPSEVLGNPSRSSVDRNADVVTVNRTASTATFIKASDCPDQDGDGLVTTSGGPDDVLPWGEDECVVWNLPIEGGGARAVAVEPRIELDGILHEYAWVGAACSGDVHEIDVEAGELTGRSVDTSPVAPYGAAMGPENALWIVPRGTEIARVDTIDLEMIQYELPAGTSSYGVTVDLDGLVWIAGMSGSVRFDPFAETFDEIPGACGGGIAADGLGRVWTAHGRFCDPQSVARIDAETLAVSHVVTGSFPYGVAVDFDGMVWAVNGHEGTAHVIDPSDESFELVWASNAGQGAQMDCYSGPVTDNYTYSDMTGSQLVLALGMDGSYSHVFEGCPAPDPTRWVELSWDAETPYGTRVTLAAMTADEPADLADARRIDLASDPPDAGPVDVEGQLDLEGVPAGRYLEIVATLYAEGIATAAPTLRRLAVTYSCADPPE